MPQTLETRPLQCQNCAHFRAQRGGQCRLSSKKRLIPGNDFESFSKVTRFQKACDDIAIADKDEIFIQVFALDKESTLEAGREVLEVIAEYTILVHSSWGDREANSFVSERHGRDARFEWNIMSGEEEF